jgi:menaquinone-dependent protoporphyrinogen IX oxidase
MKSIVVYFSQTGNTEKIANAVQAGVEQMAGHCDIARIKDANPKRLYEYDLIGIGSPLFEVTNVWQFMKSMRFVGGKHVYTFSFSVPTVRRPGVAISSSTLTKGCNRTG